MKTGAMLARHRSAQDFGTPWAFIYAVTRRFGPLWFDLAASFENRKSDRFLDISRNSLAQDWGLICSTGNLWLNPPFGNIAPWAAKCAERRNDTRWTLLLVPASVGSNWYQEHVKPNAFVCELVDRIKFEGSEEPYPKDLILAAFGFGVSGSGSWHWDASKRKRKPKKEGDE